MLKIKYIFIGNTHNKKLSLYPNHIIIVTTIPYLMILND